MKPGAWGAAIAVLVLAGCSLVPSNGTAQEADEPVTDTIEQAKAEVIAEYDRVLATLHEGSQTTRRVDTATLLSCADGGYSWPGGLFVELPADADSASVIESIRVLYGGDPLWRIEEGISSPSDHAIGLWKGGDGSAYGDTNSMSISVAVLEFDGGGSELSFQPGSRCVMMGPDFDPFTEF